MEILEFIRSITSVYDEQLLLRKVRDKLAASDRGSLSCTRFLNEREQYLCSALLDKIPHDAECIFDGGYENAERKILVFFPSWKQEEARAPRESLGAIRIIWRDKACLTHRDFLGALMHLGISRDCVGDILVDTDHYFAYVIMTRDLLDYVCNNLQNVGRSNVIVEASELSDIIVSPVKYEEICGTVSSLRVDAIIAIFCRLSREKAAALIHQGLVMIDSVPCEKPDKTLNCGNKISIRGYGKFILFESGNLTRKGRIPITLHVYL